ncbi:MAG: hypothetical protein PXZ08_08610 [Actinomycetota bacterium]|jgi:hypothetical protein|nr:hypothetical protein [Actinomycetota bacterium]
MTLTHDYLGQLRNDWRFAGRSCDSRRSCSRLRERHSGLALRDAHDLFDVVAALDTGSGRTVLERSRIVQALLVESVDPTTARALLQTLLPGVVSVCRQLRFGQGIVDEPHETVAVAVSLLHELIGDWAGQSRPYAAPDLLSALRGRLRRWLIKEKNTRLLSVPVDDLEPLAGAPSTLLTRLETLRQGPHERLARLTYECVFAGVALSDLAQADHSSVPTLKRELQVFALAHLLG